MKPNMLIFLNFPGFTGTIANPVLVLEFLSIFHPPEGILIPLRANSSLPLIVCNCIFNWSSNHLVIIGNFVSPDSGSNSWLELKYPITPCPTA